MIPEILDEGYAKTFRIIGDQYTIEWNVADKWECHLLGTDELKAVLRADIRRYNNMNEAQLDADAIIQQYIDAIE